MSDVFYTGSNFKFPAVREKRWLVQILRGFSTKQRKLLDHWTLMWF